jgi:serine/threonine protein kinase
MTTPPSFPAGQAPLTRSVTDAPLPASAPGGFVRYGSATPFKEGGGGILSKAMDTYLGREVIFKTLRPEFRDNPDVRRRFLREARVTALIQHPATVPIYEMGRDADGNPYFTMKEIRGDSLRKILNGIAAKDRKYDPYKGREVLIDILIQVGQALAYAHAAGVIHRDIKPANIMVGAFGEVMVMDWGVAKIMDGVEEDELKPPPSLSSHTPGDIDNTEHGKVYGTPRYMAPEQARGQTDIDHRVDVFSLGAVLYECLVHRPLVFGVNREELLKKICDEPFVSPARKEPYRMIPPELDAVVMKALAKSPAERYGTMAEFVEDLQRFRRGESTSVMATTYRARIQRWVKSNLPLKKTTLLLSLGLLVGYLLRGVAHGAPLP